jgi:hypothetical protein
MTTPSIPDLFPEDLNMTRNPGFLAKPLAVGVARVLMPNRSHVESRPSDLESLLPEGRRARIGWAYVERADLSRTYAGILSLICHRITYTRNPPLFVKEIKVVRGSGI